MSFCIELHLFASSLSSHKIHCSWFEREERTTVNAFMPTGNKQRGQSWEPTGMWICIQMTWDLTQYYALVFSWEHQDFPWFRELIPIWNVCHSPGVEIWAKPCIWIWTCRAVRGDLKHCHTSVLCSNSQNFVFHKCEMNLFKAINISFSVFTIC